jgi:hypothetical protein
MAGRLGSNRIRAALVAAVAVAAVAALAPATAAAADAYVNDTGHAGAPCDLGNPCNSINTGIGQTSAGATVHIDGGTYSEAVNLGNGKSLVADDFAADGGATVPTVNGAGLSAITVFSTDAGTIHGLILHSDDSSDGIVQLDHTATLTGNTFSTTTSSTDISMVFALSSAGGSVIDGNTFNGSLTAGADQVGVEAAGVPVTITANTFSDTSLAIFDHNGANGTIAGNHISGAHSATFSGAGIQVGPGGGQPTITGNTVDSPGSGANGILVSGTGGASPITGATIQRNRVIGAFSDGIKAEDTNGPVALDSNLVVGASTGLAAQDDTPFNATDGNVSATNLTLSGNSTDIQVASAVLTLDSSLVLDSVAASGTAPSCSITFSRGPSMTPGGNGCAAFQTTAAPDLGGSDGVHLLDTANNRASFIDRGNPAGSAGTLDLDGLPRRIDADAACPLNQVVDIGAYELQVAQPGCGPPTSTGPGPAPPIAKKKCKKPKKKHGAAAQAKKKKCKRRK